MFFSFFRFFLLIFAIFPPKKNLFWRSCGTAGFGYTACLFVIRRKNRDEEKKRRIESARTQMKETITTCVFVMNVLMGRGGGFGGL